MRHTIKPPKKLKFSEKSIDKVIVAKETHQRRSEDYTDMQRGQARFFTYYRFLALRRHCSVGFRCVYTSRFQEIQKRFIEKKL